MKRRLITGGTVVLPEGAKRADLLIEDEVIAGILQSAGDLPAGERLDATGLIVLPGAIDGHVHFEQNDPETAQPNEIEYEGFDHGGRGAAAGGITTICEMPQADPPTRDGRTFRRRRELASQNAIVDFAMWGGAAGDVSLAAMREQIEAGAVGFKANMHNIHTNRSFPGIDDAQILERLELLKDTPIMLGLHAENDPLLQAGLKRLKAQGRTDPLAHAESRPPIVEIEAVNRAIFFARQTGGWVHIVHMSSPDAAELIKQARRDGVRVTCETCPQYLALDLDDLVRLGPWAMCVPAMRPREQVERLWDYLADGTIDCVTSDHCGYTLASKQAAWANIFDAPGGMSGIQTLLPLVVTEGRRRGLAWEIIAERTATAPARLWNLAPKKGAIRLGADADLVLLDPEREWTIDPGELLHAHHWTPFEGMPMRGRVLRTLLRGETIYRDEAPERVLVAPGYGQFIPAQTPL